MQNLTPTTPVIPDFTPVPRKYRYDGWTAERQRAFIHALAETGSVKAAANRINMSSEGAYYLRRQPGAQEFAAAWRAALDHGVQRLEDVAMERALDGVAVPVFNRDGEQVAERRWYNDRLLMFILRHRLPWRYGPLKALAPGTKSPETLAEEARAATARDEQSNEELKRKNIDWYNNYMKERIAMARRALAEGNEHEYDLYIRQITMVRERVKAYGDEYCTRFGLMLANKTVNEIERELADYRERGVFERLAAKAKRGLR